MEYGVPYGAVFFTRTIHVAPVPYRLPPPGGDLFTSLFLFNLPAPLPILQVWLSG